MKKADNGRAGRLRACIERPDEGAPGEKCDDLASPTR
jgi:hypothetical protein